MISASGYPTAPTGPATHIARLLIVDDEAPQMRALCDTLRHQGFTADGCSDGTAALAALGSGSYDLLLTDLMMPGMDGIALLRAALAIDGDLVGIIMTGEGTIATAVEAMKSGALDYVLKPFKLSAILPVITRALAMRQLRRENAELARHVRERTEELEAANRELEAFTYSVSHDLRAPLRAIAGFSRILLENHSAALPAEAQELFGRVVDNTHRMSGLIEDLLRFSRLGRQPLSRQRVALPELVESVLTELRTTTDTSRAEVRVGELPEVIADAALLRQVFVNLLANAFKFSVNRPHALIEVGREQQDGEVVYFVRDNGAGFDMRYAHRLFTPFQRLHHESEFPGTGVGLATVHRIIQKHGGRIWAEAEVDHGATFRFTLPGAAPE